MTDDCPYCELYAMSREGVIRAEIAKTSTGAEADQRWEQFMAGVHDRHAARLAMGRAVAFMALVSEAIAEEPA